MEDYHCSRLEVSLGLHLCHTQDPHLCIPITQDLHLGHSEEVLVDTD
jgi:hypothetical protein